ncbi:MAG: CerR family C-terminal domain-containing protein [Planctomycetota bacterium]
MARQPASSPPSHEAVQSGTAETAPDKTRAKLLNAAGEVFADVGYQAATIRAICRRAEANVAAVNYHFGSKQALYNATLRHWVEIAAERYPIEPDPDADHRERLRTFIQNFLRRIIVEGRPAWHGQLMMREMSEPTSYTDEHIQQFVRPTMRVLDRMVCEWLGIDPAGDDQRDLRRRCCESVIGQIMLFWSARHVLPKIHPVHKFDDAELEAAAAHITRFSSAALDSLASDVR